MRLTEGDVQITFNNAIVCRKFDGGLTHGLSHCMKAVDFIVELHDRYLFVEIKDPLDPQATRTRTRDFLNRFNSGAIDESLKYKFRDSFLYEWASGRTTKPVDYFVIIDGVSKPLLLRRTEALKRNIPALGPNGKQWSSRFVHRIGVFDIAAWNRKFPDYQIVRLSSLPGV